MTDAVDDPYIGKTLDRRYHVRRLLGRGGMGAVYEADHIGLGKRVAIKFLLDRSPDLVARFQREARAASKLEHEHVVQIFDVGTDPSGVEFMVMEYVEGQDLRRVLEKGALPLPRALHIAKQLLSGLEAIHEAGIVHRDIKPANILLTEQDGDSDYVKVMDFGISKTLTARDEPPITKSGHVVGTPQYMAPELLRGLAASPQSDLYAAALTIYEMIAGSPPFVGSDTTQVAALHLATAPKPLDEVSDGVPVGVVRAIDRALDKSPGMRFSSALAMADALSGDGHERAAVTVQSRPRNAVREAPAQPALESQPPTKADLPSALAPQRRSHAVLYALAALIVIAVPVGVFIAMRGDSSSTAAPPPPPPTPMAVAADAAVRNTKAEQYLETARTAEASGQRELAVASYRAYLDLEPRAPDADAILAKIVELSPPPSRSAAPDAGVVAPRPRRPAAKKQCACVADREALCVEPQRVMCQCRVGSTPLCAIEPSLGTQCEAPFESEAVGGKGCQGYVHYRGAIMRGAYWCSRCTRPDVYRGHEGEPCAGHDAAGAPYKGKLQRCL